MVAGAGAGAAKRVARRAWAAPVADWALPGGLATGLPGLVGVAAVAPAPPPQGLAAVRGRAAG